ncbi:MAG TPA: electron transport complex subunit RsxB [Burkholderiaceae bacterium]|jgi:electron transport complex protein RnfB|nr:electron transport complex subunit RsxB [Burkholderiaceae bacterium]HPE02669.1 electron transport complex subunit RsxB [Burkholderiaceae bacterium]
MSSAASLADRIDAVLPQTQCTKCGYQGCRPYAEAIASGEAAINRCPPGGEPGLRKLARVTGQPLLPLDATRGRPGPLLVAVIDESLCIGCTLCIAPCPTDAIVGAARRMHTVLPELCTGCELCVPPCPMDCIRLVQAGREWTEADAALARSRHQTRAERLVRERSRHEARLEAKAVAKLAEIESRDELTAAGIARKKAVVEAAIARARARRTAAPESP